MSKDGYITGLSPDHKRGNIQEFGEFSAYGGLGGIEVGQYSFTLSTAPIGIDVGMMVRFDLDEGLSVTSITSTGRKVKPSFGRDF